ncbi:hypothetical protein ADK97_25215 [Streptomyces sp. H021]|nr:hypothetical protein ADK97_25215 [Streptomyces sp. H021]
MFGFFLSYSWGDRTLAFLTRQAQARSHWPRHAGKGSKPSVRTGSEGRAVTEQVRRPVASYKRRTGKPPTPLTTSRATGFPVASRDFASRCSMRSSRYEVVVDEEVSDEAAGLIGGMQTTGRGPTRT